ncbi:MAG: CBS domain-containing protein [Pirellulales bacterium]
MTTKLVTVLPEASVEEAIRILVKYQICGAPVVDGQGRLQGLISEFQLLEVAYDPHIKEAKVKDLMTHDVLTVGANALLTTVANLFVTHRIRRVPVVDNGRLIGLVSRRDVLRYMIETGKPIENFFNEMRSFVCDVSDMTDVETVGAAS